MGPNRYYDDVAAGGFTWIIISTTRVITWIEWKYDRVRDHMPEIIRVQMGDLELKVKELARENIYLKARVDEQNATVRNAAIQNSKTDQILRAIQGEDEIARARRRKRL